MNQSSDVYNIKRDTEKMIDEFHLWKNRSGNVILQVSLSSPSSVFSSSSSPSFREDNSRDQLKFSYSLQNQRDNLSSMKVKRRQSSTTEIRFACFRIQSCFHGRDRERERKKERNRDKPG